MKIEYTAILDRGKVRTENQDTLFLPEQRPVNANAFDEYAAVDLTAPCTFAAFDGMGGALCGKEASMLAAQTLATQESDADLTEACMAMNREICQYMQTHAIKSMGTTAAIVRLSEGKLEYCNVGDSRIYLIKDLQMYRLSKDHTMEMFGGHRALTQYLGVFPEEMLIEPHSGALSLGGECTLLLCSDGLTDLLSEPEIGKLIVTNNNRKAACALKDEALRRGGKDNISIILIRIS